MSDAEWDAWQSSWSGAAGPLPDVHARARQMASRDRRARLFFLGMMAVTDLAVAANVMAGHQPVVGVGLLTFGAVIAVGVLWIQRRVGAQRAPNPREALAFLERRVRVERQGAQLARWLYVALFVFMMFSGTLADAPWYVRLFGVGILLVQVAIMFTAPWWMRRYTDRQQAEIDQWRRWMDEQQL